MSFAKVGGRVIGEKECHGVLLLCGCIEWWVVAMGQERHLFAHWSPCLVSARSVPL